jgi:hypothetical protein
MSTYAVLERVVMLSTLIQVERCVSVHCVRNGVNLKDVGFSYR